jgi:hypothetical protein
MGSTNFTPPPPLKWLTPPEKKLVHMYGCHNVLTESKHSVCTYTAPQSFMPFKD